MLVIKIASLKCVNGKRRKALTFGNRLYIGATMNNLMPIPNPRRNEIGSDEWKSKRTCLQNVDVINEVNNDSHHFELILVTKQQEQLPMGMLLKWQADA